MIPCLLCRQSNAKQMKINSKKGKELNCSAIIAQHFWIKPNAAKSSAQSVCLPCWDVLLAFHLLYETVSKAHNYFECKVSNDAVLLESEENQHELDNLEPTTKVEANESHNKSTIVAENDIAIPNPNSADTMCLKQEKENIKTETAHKTIRAQTTTDDDSEAEIPLSMLKSNKDLRNEQAEPSDFNLTQMETMQTAIESSAEHYNEPNVEHFSDNESAAFINDSDFHTDCSSDFELTDEDVQTKNEKHTKPTVDHNENIAKFFEKLECRKCKMSFQKFDDLSVHTETAHNSPPTVLCCGRTFRRANTLSCHVLVHLNPHHLKCSHCDKLFESQLLLEQHVKTDHQCNKCTKSFPSKKDLHKHQLDAHSMKLPNKFMCPVCDKNFSTRRKLYEHKRCVHGEKVSCDLCGKELKNRWSLHKHLRNHQNHKCDQCMEAFSSKKNLRQHQLTAHEIEQNSEFVCPECNKMFSTRRKLYEHKRSTHAAGAKTFCDICGLQLTSRISFYWHMRKHQDQPVVQDPVECDICGKWIKYRNNLKQHKEWVHGKRFEFECPICKKLSASKHALHGHIKRMHNSESSFPCTMCEKVFKSSFDMREHINTHTKEKQFPCEVCSKIFFRKATLQRHMRKVHSIQPALRAPSKSVVKEEISLEDFEMQL